MTPSGLSMGTILKMYRSLSCWAAGLLLIRKSTVPVHQQTVQFCSIYAVLLLYRSSMPVFQERDCMCDCFQFPCQSGSHILSSRADLVCAYFPVQTMVWAANAGDFFVCFLLDICIVPMGFLPWEIQIAFPGESQLQQSCATQPTMHAGCFNVSIIHRIMTWTAGWDFSHGKYGLLSLGKASCDRVALPNILCMLSVIAFL